MNERKESKEHEETEEEDQKTPQNQRSQFLHPSCLVHVIECRTLKKVVCPYALIGVKGKKESRMRTKYGTAENPFFDEQFNFETNVAPFEVCLE